MTCAVKSNKYLVDVALDAFHKTVTFGNLGTVGSNINPRPNTITDILRLVLVTVLLTLCNDVLHFRFREAYIQRVGLLFFLTFQVLAFIICELVLVLVGKAIVKLGSNVFVQSIVDSSLVGYSLKLHNFLLGRSAPLAFNIFHNVFSFVSISALADFSLSVPQTSGIEVSPTSIVFSSMCGTKYNACYFCGIIIVNWLGAVIAQYGRQFCES